MRGFGLIPPFAITPTLKKIFFDTMPLSQIIGIGAFHKILSCGSGIC
jgi:hypothetical protein